MNRKSQLWVICLSVVVMVTLVGGSRVDASFQIDLNKVYDSEDFSFQIGGYFNDETVGISDLNISYRGKGNLVIGRKKMKMGPGHFAQLMLSDQSSLDLIYYEDDYKLWFLSFKGQMLVAMIDEEINKQFLAHRISLNPFIPGLEIGLSESMMVHEKINPFYYIPLPYWPYYLTTKVTGIYSEYNFYEDKYIGIDFTYQFLEESKIYGELLVDEYPQVSWATNPHKLAHLIGVYHPLTDNWSLRVEYSNVFNYVYIHRFPENVYLNQGTPLGHWLGPDSELLDLEIEKQIEEDTVRIGLRQIRLGIGDYNIDYGADHLEKKFMSQVTEQQVLLRLGYEKKMNDFLTIELSSEVGKSFDLINDSSDVIGTMDVGVKLDL